MLETYRSWRTRLLPGCGLELLWASNLRVLERQSGIWIPNFKSTASELTGLAVKSGQVIQSWLLILQEWHGLYWPVPRSRPCRCLVQRETAIRMCTPTLWQTSIQVSVSLWIAFREGTSMFTRALPPPPGNFFGKNLWTWWTPCALSIRQKGISFWNCIFYRCDSVRAGCKKKDFPISSWKSRGNDQYPFGVVFLQPGGKRVPDAVSTAAIISMNKWICQPFWNRF